MVEAEREQGADEAHAGDEDAETEPSRAPMKERRRKLLVRPIAVIVIESGGVAARRRRPTSRRCERLTLHRCRPCLQQHFSSGVRIPLLIR
jgi:hypothetical protein